MLVGEVMGTRLTRSRSALLGGEAMGPQLQPGHPGRPARVPWPSASRGVCGAERVPIRPA